MRYFLIHKVKISHNLIVAIYESFVMIIKHRSLPSIQPNFP